ncbi:hypothetical protein PR202_gb03413 [Eleusine coracana subsp. coracana]|uniref:AMP-activated protein kinase glycogen-binding domain-containing protein n=1 Tax=Eleusine coracana subsp. coracana TaxID=191504 RepID=A0AAV5E1L2_ELECO|nr:hypothetical protein PR202_gb03413 [Eleusine coracana subsp. coracana]
MAAHLHLLHAPALAITATTASAPGGCARSTASPGLHAASWSPARLRRRPGVAVCAASDGGGDAGHQRSLGDGSMRLNEYMVTVDRPLGVRFALGVDGRVFVHSLRKGGNAEKSRIIMVGDTLKKAGGSEGLVTIKDLGDTEIALKDKSGPCSLILERPFAPFPIHQLHQNEDYHLLFNKGRVPVTSWNGALLSTKLSESSEGAGKPGFAIFSPKMLTSQGWGLVSSEKGGLNQSSTNLANRISEIVGLYSDEDDVSAEWAHGSFPLEEYIKALDRAKGELYYNHSLGMQYSKGITAVLNFQSESERINWGINSEAINNSCRENNILMINYPIRSPACVISYLHWVQDTPLHIAYKFITGLHSCRPDRAAIVWATWDLIALVENGRHDGSPTHSVCFVWNSGREGEDVELVGDFTSNWKDKVRCNHKGGPRYEAEVRLRHGKEPTATDTNSFRYYYKFIVGGQWRHSSSLPTETDEHGNVNNVIRVGDIARIRPAPSQLHIRVCIPTAFESFE